MTHERNSGCWTLAAMTALALVLSAPAAGAAGKPAQGGNGHGTWAQFLDQVRSQAAGSPAAKAAHADVRAGQADASAAEHDTGLSLDGNTQYYPNGVGAGASSGFTNLRQRAEIRVDWNMLDFIARRGGRIDRAQARKQLARAKARQARLQAASQIVDDAACAWATPRRTKALQRARHDARLALKHARAAENAPSTALARKAEQMTPTAASLAGQIQARLAGLETCSGPVPRLPGEWSALPLQAPSGGAVTALARHDPRVAELRARAAVSEGRAGSLTADGVKIRLFGGYVAERRQDLAGTQTGPEIGASITVPLGSAGGDSRAAAQWRARSLSLQAQAMLRQRQRQLRQLRQQWARAAARIESTGDQLRQAHRQLHRLELRAAHQAAGNTPEPWEIELQRARLWLDVDRMWQARRQWVQSVLTWTLRSPKYLQEHHHGHGAPASGLCAPLAGCPS
ncbi:MAG TPA: TolC family protein [Gammaproteobacteria bacterium]|nr:TolC family protein [Gammaproteobacteria bacterium]